MMKINTMLVDDLDAMMTQIRATWDLFEDQYDWNIASPRDNYEEVTEVNYKDFQETARKLIHKIEVMLVETKGDVSGGI